MKIKTKNEFTSNNKDNVGIATILAVSLFAIASGIFVSNPAVANHATHAAVRKMDAIVVTASRVPEATFDTIVVTASRNISHL